MVVVAGIDYFGMVKKVSRDLGYPTLCDEVHGPEGRLINYAYY